MLGNLALILNIAVAISFKLEIKLFVRVCGIMTRTGKRDRFLYNMAWDVECSIEKETWS